VVEEEATIPKTLNEFKTWEFTSGPTTGEDFKVFARMFKSHITKSLPEGARLVQFNIGHYYLSGFIQRDDRFVYFSISDVRFFPSAWHQHILVRTAESDRDYTGGSNGYTTLGEFTNAVNGLLS
jgi:hypothetical protein